MAIRINRVYTRTGDKGETALVGGKRVPKDSLRIEAYGTVDELNSIIGLARVFNAERLQEGPAHGFLDEILRDIQQELFDLGTDLATPPELAAKRVQRVGQEQVRRIEEIIDHCQKDLEPLKSFILPGGGRIGGYLHHARTVCRRAEREILRLSRTEEVGPWTLQYSNRLSDLLFVLARWVGKQLGEKEYLWERGLEPEPEGTKGKK